LFVLPIASFLAYAEFSTHRGRAKAEALCNAIPVGTNVRAAEASIASVETDELLRFSSETHLGAGFRGAFTERWVCNATISQEMVIQNEVRLID
jgi:hypothetical protein